MKLTIKRPVHWKLQSKNQATDAAVNTQTSLTGPASTPGRVALRTNLPQVNLKYSHLHGDQSTQDFNISRSSG